MLPIMVIDICTLGGRDGDKYSGIEFVEISEIFAMKDAFSLKQSFDTVHRSPQ